MGEAKTADCAGFCGYIGRGEVKDALQLEVDSSINSYTAFALEVALYVEKGRARDAELTVSELIAARHRLWTAVAIGRNLDIVLDVPDLERFCDGLEPPCIGTGKYGVANDQ